MLIDHPSVECEDLTRVSTREICLLTSVCYHVGSGSYGGCACSLRVRLHTTKRKGEDTGEAACGALTQIVDTIWARAPRAVYSHAAQSQHIGPVE